MGNTFIICNNKEEVKSNESCWGNGGKGSTIMLGLFSFIFFERRKKHNA